MEAEHVEQKKTHEDSSQDDEKLWGLKDVAEFLGYSENHVRNRVVCLPNFPKRCKHFKNRWVSKEVRSWATQK